MGSAATRMCQLLVGLPAVTILGVIDEHLDGPILVVMESVQDGVERCASCGSPARIKDRDPVLLTDLPAFALTVYRCPTGRHRRATSRPRHVAVDR